MTPIDEQQPNTFFWTPRDRPWRWLLALGATVSALAHLPVISPHLAEAPYIGEEFIVLTVACLLVAVAAIVCDSAAVYGLGILTCGLAATGYVATRLITFPQLADDVGNWFEPLGVVSVLAESVAVIAALRGLRHPRSDAVAGMPDLPAAPGLARPVAPGASAAPVPVAPWAAVPVDPRRAQYRAEPDDRTSGSATSNPGSAPSWPEWRTPVGVGGTAPDRVLWRCGVGVLGLGRR